MRHCAQVEPSNAVASKMHSRAARGSMWGQAASKTRQIWQEGPGHGVVDSSPAPQPIFHTPICIILPFHSFLTLCVFQWLQSSSSW